MRAGLSFCVSRSPKRPRRVASSARIRDSSYGGGRRWKRRVPSNVCEGTDRPRSPSVTGRSLDSRRSADDGSRYNRSIVFGRWRGICSPDTRFGRPTRFNSAPRCYGRGNARATGCSLRSMNGSAERLPRTGSPFTRRYPEVCLKHKTVLKRICLVIGDEPPCSNGHRSDLHSRQRRMTSQLV